MALVLKPIVKKPQPTGHLVPGSMTTTVSSEAESAGLNVCRFKAFATLRRFVFYLLSCLKGSEAGHRDVRVMDKQIVTAIIGCDESESLVLVKPLYRTCIQMFFSSAQKNGPATLTTLFFAHSTGSNAKGVLLTTESIEA
jgi:hypothetical protein